VVGRKTTLAGGREINYESLTKTKAYDDKGAGDKWGKKVNTKSNTWLQESNVDA
jgi:hypothetical protein